MNISIIIPNYNGAALLEKNLPKVLASIQEYTDGKIEIIIPDDASTDNSVQAIASFIASIKDKHIVGKTVSNTKRSDGGFSKNVNRGVQVATGDILVLLNSDVVPYKGFLAPLLAHFSDSNVFAVGCMDESKENGQTVLRGRGVGTWKKGFLQHSAGALDKNTTLWVSCGSGAFRKSLWDKLGGLNELYNPFYWEDIDISYRAQKVGYTVVFEKKSRVIHEHSKGAIQSNYKPYNVQKIVYRNQFSFVWLNITDRNLLVSHFFWLPYHLINALRDKDRAMVVGFVSACCRIGEIQKYRKKMKKLFHISDKAILKQL